LLVRVQHPGAVVLLRWGVRLLAAIGGLCLALFFWYEWEATYFQTAYSHAFDEQRQRAAEIPPGHAVSHAAADLTSPHHPPSAASSSGVVGRLEIPRIGVEVMVLKGADPSTLQRGAGWLPDTARPGAGNAAIAAHRDTYFRPLREIQEGDMIRLTTLDTSYDFRVEWTAVVDPDDTAVLGPTREPVLTLITCYPFYYVGKAPQRFVVRARRQNPAEEMAGNRLLGNRRPTRWTVPSSGGGSSPSNTGD
jgi:sortase A